MTKFFVIVLFSCVFSMILFYSVSSMILFYSILTILFSWLFIFILFYIISSGCKSLYNVFRKIIIVLWRNKYKIFTIFIIGLVSRIFINNFFNINVFVEYNSLVSWLYYLTMSCLTVIINSTEFSVIDTFFNNLDSLTFSNIKKGILNVLSSFNNDNNKMIMHWEGVSEKSSFTKKTIGITNSMNSGDVNDSNDKDTYRFTQRNGKTVILPKHGPNAPLFPQLPSKAPVSSQSSTSTPQPNASSSQPSTEAPVFPQSQPLSYSFVHVNRERVLTFDLGWDAIVKQSFNANDSV